MSRIFTEAETKALEERIKGNKKDPTGIYASRVKPKIIELIKWFHLRNKLKKLIKVK